MILDQRTVDLFRARQLAELEEREPEQVARALVARLVPQRFLQRDAGLGGIALRQQLVAGRQRAIEFLIFGEIGIVFVEDAVLRCAGARVGHSPGSRFDASFPCAAWALSCR